MWTAACTVRSTYHPHMARRGGMRNKLNEWWRQRQDQAAAEAAEAASYFEWAEANELHRAVEHAHNTYAVAIRECDRMGKQAGKQAAAAQEHERAARLAGDKHRAASRLESSDEAETAMAAAIKAWRAAGAAAQKEADAWREAGAEAWKAAGLMTECGQISTVMTSRAKYHATGTKGKDHKAAETRIKAALAWEGDVRDQSEVKLQHAVNLFKQCSSYGAAAAAWAAAAAGIADAFTGNRTDPSTGAPSRTAI